MHIAESCLNKKQAADVFAYIKETTGLIYNRIGKKPVLAIEVDGYAYHKKDTVQDSRDQMKDRILELYQIPFLRFLKNGSGEAEKIRETLEILSQ